MFWYTAGRWRALLAAVGLPQPFLGHQGGLVILAHNTGQGGRTGLQSTRNAQHICMLTTSRITPGFWADGRCAGRGLMRFLTAFLQQHGHAGLVCIALLPLPADVLGGRVLGRTAHLGALPPRRCGTGSGSQRVFSERAAVVGRKDCVSREFVPVRSRIRQQIRRRRPSCRATLRIGPQNPGGNGVIILLQWELVRNGCGRPHLVRLRPGFARCVPAVRAGHIPAQLRPV